MFGGAWGASWGVFVRDPFFAAFIKRTAVVALSGQGEGGECDSLVVQVWCNTVSKAFDV